MWGGGAEAHLAPTELYSAPGRVLGCSVLHGGVGVTPGPHASQWPHERDKSLDGAASV